MGAAQRLARLAACVLPVSGVAVTLRPPTGAEDLLLLEHDIADPALTLALAERLAVSDAVTDWAGLAVSDIDTLVLRLRQAVVGNRVIAELACAAEGCGQMVDLSFTIEAWMSHHRPRRPSGRGSRIEAEPDPSPWFTLLAGGDEARFRLPTLADQVAVDGVPDAAAALAARCIRPLGLSGRARHRVEAAMAALAPPLSGPLQGRCPHCGAAIAARFEARLYCLRELQDRAHFIHDDVDTLAERYHWSERAILTLPHARRASYVERARHTRPG